MKKKSVALLFVMTAALSLFACSKKEGTPDNSGSQAEITQSQTEKVPDSNATPTAGQVSINIDEVKLPENPKQVIYNQQYTNYAEVPVDEGFMISADGNVYHYDFACGTELWMRENGKNSGNVISDEDFITTYTLPICQLDEATLKQFYGLIQKVDMNEELKTESAGCDMGSHTKAVSVDGRNFCVLDEYGDYSGTLTGQGAADVLAFIENTVQPVISKWTVPDNLGTAYVTPGHCELVNVKNGDWTIGDSWFSSNNYLVTSKGQADYLKKIYNIDLAEYLSNYNDYYTTVFYAVMYDKVNSTGYNIEYAGCAVNSNGITPIQSENYSAPENDEIGNESEEFLTIAEIPAAALFYFYDDGYVIPEWSVLDEYNSEAESYALKIAEEFNGELVPDAYKFTDGSYGFQFRIREGIDRNCIFNINVMCGEQSGEIKGAVLGDYGYLTGPKYVYDADGKMILSTDNSKPVSLNPASEQKEEDTVILYKGEDICNLDSLKNALLNISDAEGMDEFQDEVIIDDGGWYTIKLTRELKKYSDEGTSITRLDYMLVLDTPYAYSYGENNGLLATTSIWKEVLPDGIVDMSEIKETASFPESDTYTINQYSGKDGNVFMNMEEVWSSYTDGGALGQINITDGTGKELFRYEPFMEYITGVDIAEVTKEMGKKEAVLTAENDAVMKEITEAGVYSGPLGDVFKTESRVFNLDGGNSLKVDLSFFEFEDNLDVSITCFLNDNMIVDSRAFGGH